MAARIVSTLLRNYLAKLSATCTDVVDVISGVFSNALTFNQIALESHALTVMILVQY
jgi:hypothetical protein